MSSANHEAVERRRLAIERGHAALADSRATYRKSVADALRRQAHMYEQWKTSEERKSGHDAFLHEALSGVVNELNEAAAALEKYEETPVV